MHLVFPPPFPWLFLGPYTSSLIIGHNSPPAHLQCNAHVVYAAWPPPFQLPTSAVHFASSPLPPPSFFWLFSVCPTFLESTKIDLFSGHHPIKSNQKKLIPLLHYVAMLHLFLHKIIKTKYK